MDILNNLSIGQQCNNLMEKYLEGDRSAFWELILKASFLGVPYCIGKFFHEFAERERRQYSEDLVARTLYAKIFIKKKKHLECFRGNFVYHFLRSIDELYRQDYRTITRRQEILYDISRYRSNYPLTPDIIMIAKESQQYLFERLGETLSKIVLLRAHGFQNREIANILGFTEATVRVYMVKAKDIAETIYPNRTF